MRLLDDVALAVRRLRHRPWRSFLLLQGTIWGVGVSLLTPAVMLGTRRAALEHGASIGADRITIAADPTAVDTRALTMDDIERVRTSVEATGIRVDAASGVRLFAGAKGPAGVDEAVDWLFGPPDAPIARGLTLLRGRTFDPAASPGECVVEGLLAGELARAAGLGDDPARAIGTTLVSPFGTRTTVVGVCAPRDPVQRRTNDLGMDTEHHVFKSVTGKLLLAVGVPLGDDRWKRTDRCVYAPATGAEVDWIYLRVAPADVRAAAGAAEKALAAAGKAVVRFYPPAYPMLIAKELDRFRTVPLALFLACLAMGAVVMAHVGLLEAMRRAGEIAIHRAEGATRRDVVTQFLAEGGVLALLGAFVGWAVGCGLAELRVRLEPTAGVTWRFPWPEAAVALVVSVVVGVLACVVPARRAAGLEPSEALADE